MCIFPTHFDLTRHERNSSASRASPCRDSLNQGELLPVRNGHVGSLDAAPELGHVEWRARTPPYRRLMSSDSALLLIPLQGNFGNQGAPCHVVF
jgi:hypothetical protein